MRRLTEAVVYMHDNGEQVHVCVSEGEWVGGCEGECVYAECVRMCTCLHVYIDVINGLKCISWHNCI